MLCLIMWVAFWAGHAGGVWYFYTLRRGHAEHEAANGKTYHYSCGNPFKCEGTEVSQHVSQFSDVYLPTALYAILLPLFVLIVYILLTHKADPTNTR